VADIPELIFIASLFAECKELISYQSSATTAFTKEDGSLVTELDEALASLAKERITVEYPNDAIICEEGSAEHRAHRTWIIDPLDGTTNFTRGLPIFAISVALAEGTSIIVGGVLIPQLNQTFLAAEGRGAYLGHNRLVVSKKQVLDFGSIVTFCSWRSQDMGLVRLPCNMRAFGSTAYHLALLASGATEGAIELGCRIWDFAAGALLVSEAGGTVHTQYGMRELMDPDASNQLVRVFAASNQENLQQIEAAGSESLVRSLG
jgi:myo-inositol-1(or 4)-monophosphatase